jgi:cytochrome c biogenesis protein CcmG/thiol:disulfide interchange protein DsbE
MRTLTCAVLAGTAILLLAAAVPAADRAPDFKLPDLKGETVQLSVANAKNPVLVTFWATWCVPCPEELKHVQKLYEQYKDRGLTVLAISIDGTKSVAQVKPFVDGRRFTFPVLLDTNNDAKRSFLVKAVPSLFLLKPGGEIAFQHVGYRAGDEVTLENEIKKLFAELPPTAATSPAPAESPASPPSQTPSSGTEGQ